MNWVLVIFLHAGILSGKDSMAVTTVGGFKSQAACADAGKQSEILGKSTTKDVKWTCLEVK